MIDPMNLINGKGMALRYKVGTPAVRMWELRNDDFPVPIHTPLVVGIPMWDVREVDAWWVINVDIPSRNRGTK